MGNLILVLTLSLTYFIPNFAGIIGLTIWILGLFIPLSILTEINQLLYQEQYTKARKLSKYLKYLHPFDSCLELSQILIALEIAHQGDIVKASQIIENYQNRSNSLYYHAKILLFWFQGDWENCLNYFQKEIKIKNIDQDSNLLIYYLRVLGENGKIEELLNQFTIAEPILAKTGDKNKINLAKMLIFAFSGEKELLEKLFNYSLNFYSKNTQRFWLITAQFYRGEKTEAIAKFNDLKEISNLVLINNINWRLSQNLNQDHNNQLSQKLITKLKKTLQDEIDYQNFTKINLKKAYLTQGLIIINFLLFFLEIQIGGSTNLEVLEKLGALIPEYIWEGEYWRLITANFLHYGWLHLSMNMFALWIVGTFVETIIGRFFYGLIYFLSGIGAMIIFTFISPYIISPNMPILLVGASGAIMGLVGVILAIFIKFTYQKKSAIFAQKLRFLLFIILLQFIFDFFTPQVSFAIHSLGFILGLITGLFVPIKSEN